MNANTLHLRNTSCGSPEQYDVIYHTQKVGYIHLQHGYLRCFVPDPQGIIVYETGNFQGDGWFTSEYERNTHLMGCLDAIAKHYTHIEEEKKKLKEEQERLKRECKERDSTFPTVFPCPFCGGKNTRAYRSMNPFYIEYYVRCDDCGATGPVKGYYAVAVAAWNRAGKKKVGSGSKNGSGNNKTTQEDMPDGK